MARAQPCVASKLPAAEWKGFATTRTTRPSVKVQATRQCFSLPRRSRIALETSSILKAGAQLFVRQDSIAQRALRVALEHSRFNSSTGELLFSMFAESGGIWQLFARVFSHRHPSNAPRVQCNVDRIGQRRIGDVRFLQKLFH